MSDNLKSHFGGHVRLLTLLLLFMNSSLGAAALPKGTSLLPDKGLFAFELSNHPERGKAEQLTAEGKKILRLQTTAENNENPWDVQAVVKIAAPVAKGDVIMANFWIRGISSRLESGESETIFIFELDGEPHTKSLDHPIRAGKEWLHMQIPFASDADYMAGQARLIFRMGYRPQIFEVKDISVLNYGKALKLESLPRTKISYPGRELNAPWRKAAAERIAKHRTAEIKLGVLDASGAPLPGARIEITQLKNAFHFGSATSGHYIFHDSDAAGRAKYESITKKYFNMATEENGLKWQPLGGDWDKTWNMELAHKSADWVRSLGLDFRGHVLIWPGFRNMPKTAIALKDDRKALHKAVFDRIEGMAKAMKGKVKQWDVMNEPFDNHDLMDIFGNDIMVDFFKVARKADPEAELYINDYAILAGGGGDTPHRRHYEETIKFLVDKGAPFEGIGMQGHFGLALTNPDDAMQILDRYAKFGKKIMITEYDISIDDLDLAGDYTRDILTVLYSHPAVTGFITWGFWDGAHWHKNAPFFKADWSPKPAALAWENLVLNEWRTKASGQSGQDGGYKVNGHLGDYEIKVSRGGKTLVKKARLGKDGLELKLILK